MKKIYLSLIGIVALFGFTQATAQTLFTFGKYPVSKEEFLRIYEKNNAQKKPDYSDSSIKDYLNLYSLFRMKVKEAEEIKLDTTAAVQNELENYKNQLAKSYLVDKEVTNDLVKEAYDRMKSELRVAHILIAVRPNTDSLKAKATADSLYTILQNKKANFAELAKQYSDDKSTADQGGDIGYITALQVAYPFETIAYQTRVGQISKPFRTQFGYHILKVEDKRPNRGQVQVAQILIATPKSKGEEGKVEAEKKAALIMKELNNKVPFEDLVRKYSDDRFSNQNKGILEPISVGKITPVFEDIAFGLQKPGDISKPFETQYGIHILKLIKKTPLSSFDNMRDELSSMVEKDTRSSLAKESYLEKVKQQLHFKEYPENLNEFLSAFAYDTSKTIQRENYKSFQQPLFELNNKVYKQNDFLDFVFKLTNGNLFGKKTQGLTDLYKVYQTNSIQEIQQENLEAKNPEYKALVQEYKNGIMLFDLMDKKIWSKASQDTMGLQKYYETHKSKYQWEPGFEGTIYTSTDQKELKELKELLDKGMNTNDALEKLSEEGKSNGIHQHSGRFEFASLPLESPSYQNNKTTFIYLNEDHSSSFADVLHVYPTPQQKSLEEARGFVVADYQDFLEKEWNQHLKEKYPVVINEKVLKTIIK